MYAGYAQYTRAVRGLKHSAVGIIFHETALVGDILPYTPTALHRNLARSHRSTRYFSDHIL